jgi:hypothetical protein
MDWLQSLQKKTVRGKVLILLRLNQFTSFFWPESLTAATDFGEWAMRVSI